MAKNAVFVGNCKVFDQCLRNKILRTAIANDQVANFLIAFFDWHQVSEAFAPTNLGGAQALGKEFPASAPQVIQEAIKFPQSDGPKGLNAPKRC